MDADTGKAVLDDDGNEITASKEFVAPAKDGSVDITFNFVGVSLAGKTIVAFEEVITTAEDMLFMQIFR